MNERMTHKANNQPITFLFLWLLELRFNGANNLALLISTQFHEIQSKHWVKIVTH